MSSIPPILKYLEGFTVTGLSTQTQNSNEFNEKTARLPSLWQQFYSSNLADNANLFEVYSDYESDANGLYTVTLGITDNSDHTGAEFVSVKIPAGNYLVFQGEGPMPSTVVETWKQIWDYFNVKSNYQRSFISDFEAYIGADKVAIYIGII